ncbi:uncharacterized protein BDR25DRAFT_309449 [Lindgomyces ingoldianus]|uniref:Uncharacterized protein n=1 Tax=Lindgomyces ingoldianus TaxID=673940 RepID=A0ACB6RCW8_9PLEO|nr:uncharacterized protein BDR25DRAFT_309449 [Lindgomyces ingoldianus]KAF2477169.1 hypothetical protein BDR25DRAFT_309449 [Lindgomyces ingoldianus]
MSLYTLSSPGVVIPPASSVIFLALFCRAQGLGTSIASTAVRDTEGSTSTSTTSPAQRTFDSNIPKDRSKNEIPMIVGIVLGVIAFFICLLVLSILIWRRQERRMTEKARVAGAKAVGAKAQLWELEDLDATSAGLPPYEAHVSPQRVVVEVDGDRKITEIDGARA